jgi:RNA 2',3'-cyclic 3'-phosphodiesterase
VRLFVAVSPPEDVLALVEALPRPNLEKLRWTTPEQWHVTMRFLGEVEQPEPVAEAMRALPSDLRRSGVTEVEAVLGPAVAWFTGRRVLQVPVGGIEALAEAVQRATSKWGGKQDHPGFVGHLTIARVRGDGHGPINLAGTPIRASWKVNDVLLVASTLGPGGARYETLESVTIGA